MSDNTSSQWRKCALRNSNTDSLLYSRPEALNMWSTQKVHEYLIGASGSGSGGFKLSGFKP
ncbi:hypothetical protein VCV18_004301 [Metarhizium anisopliae]